MAVTMLDKQAEKTEKSQWPADIAAEFERESKNPNPCVGSTLLSENERTRVWIIRLAPGELALAERHELLGRVQGARPGKSRRPRDGLHDRRIQGQRQQADVVALRRKAAIRGRLNSSVNHAAVGHGGRFILSWAGKFWRDR